MEELHPDTVIFGNGWYTSRQKIKNIPEPCWITFDTYDTFSDHLPTIFVQVEPQIVRQSEQYLIENYHKYHTIFTFNQNVLDKCPNAKKYVYATSWVSSDNIDISKKQFKISSLSGSKRIGESRGHVLRQVLYHHQHLFHDIPFTWYRSRSQIPHLIDYGNNPFISSTYSAKNELFDEFQFALVIENSKETNYFTEKIMDCIVTKTIPLYWGCPNIAEYFDTTGWIILETESVEELLEKCKILTSDYYSRYTNIIEKNYETAKQYVHFIDNLNNAVSPNRNHL
jgi:hypothetical protein